MRSDSRAPHPLSSWRLPLVTVLGMSAAVAIVAVVDGQPGALVLVAVLAMSMSRSRLVENWRGRAEAVVLLPVTGLATYGVGELLQADPWVGAALFVVAMFLSIWLRRFGLTGSRVGSLIALPFITLLIVPGGGAATTPGGAVLLSLLAFVVVVVIRLLAELTHLLPPATPSVEFDQRASSLVPIVSTRMAIQLALALAAAFVVGGLLFPAHITWVVLTAYLVCSGNRGRADVLYKSGLRIVGATAGTLAAATGLSALIRADVALQGPLLVIVVLALVGLGLWLRGWTYAAWALVVTLVITLLQVVAQPAAGRPGGFAPIPVGAAVWARVLAIVLGAILGVAASWFVLPVRSQPVLRRRISEALAALSDFLADPSPRADRVLESRLLRLDEVARPWRALARATPWRHPSITPAEWMTLVHQSATLARRHPEMESEVRQALGAARSALRDPSAVGPALARLRDALAGQGRMEA